MIRRGAIPPSGTQAIPRSGTQAIRPSGTQAMKDLALLEYRYALDASMPWLVKDTPIVRCHVPHLREEVRQRVPLWAKKGSVALWVEPLRSSWQEELEDLSARLSDEGLLIIVASRPLARLLPERASSPEPLGVRLGGITQLCRGLQQNRFVVERNDGIHSLQAIVLNSLSQQVARWGRSALGDRLHFAARLRYRTTGPLAAFSTVALLMARKEHDSWHRK